MSVGMMPVMATAMKKALTIIQGGELDTVCIGGANAIMAAVLLNCARHSRSTGCRLGAAEENASVKPWLKCRNFSEASRPGARRTAWQSLSKRYTNSRYGRLRMQLLLPVNRHNSTPRSLVLTFSRWRCWALACCFACSSSLRMEGFFSFSRFFAENSRKAAVMTSASRPLKNTR